VTTESKRTGRKRGNNEGTIVQRGDGRWVAAATRPDGKRKWLYGKSRREVQEKLTAALRDVQQGLPLPSGRQTLGQFLDTWLADVVKPSVRPGTYTSYEQKVRVHIAPALGKLPLDKVTPQAIQAFMNQKRTAGLSPRSVQYFRAILRRALGQALKWGLVARNAATLVEPPKLARKPIVVLTAAQSRTLMESVRGDSLEPLIVLTLATGLRRGEALGLRWSDLDLDDGTLTVRGQYQKLDGAWTWVEPKTDASIRTLALPPYVAASLRAHRARQLEERLAVGPAWVDYDLVFPSALGAPPAPESVSHMFKKRVKRAGLPPISFHGLRHSAATLMLAQGMSIAEIQKVMGHSQISLTANLYAHAAPEIMGRAADTMERLFGTG
jgi:integrase